VSSNWDDPSEMLSRAQAARAQGDRDLAYQLYARASEINPQDVNAWQGRAETATSSDEALVSYAYAAALDTENQPLARTLDAALAQRVHDAGKSDVPLLVALGQEFAEVGLTERAQSLLERASELDTSSTDALVWLAGTATDDQKQLDYLNRALATNPRDPRARAGLLSVKLPPPPSATPPPSRSERLAALSASSNAPAPPIADTAAETATMERLRKLRASVPPAEPQRAAASPVEGFRAAAPSTDTRMRNILILLVVVVVLLALAGFVLLQLQ
jgi:tetratricopeptide (TPR) repeat protein